MDNISLLFTLLMSGKYDNVDITHIQKTMMDLLYHTFGDQMNEMEITVFA